MLVFWGLGGGKGEGFVIRFCFVLCVCVCKVAWWSVVVVER